MSLANKFCAVALEAASMIAHRQATPVKRQFIPAIFIFIFIVISWFVI